MAILEGGIFSNPRGKTGGIVFGAARTRTGKKVTSRLLVPPSNPNTAAQQVQRGKFAEALAIVRLLGSGIYQSDFNRSIGQLPGFQSVTSIFLNALDASEDIGVIPSINLGSLHKSATFAAVAGGGGTGEVAVTWSTENGINGTTADVMVLLGVAEGPAGTPLEREVLSQAVDTRTSGAAVIAFVAGSLDVIVMGYFRGAGAAEGLLSATSFDTATTAA